MKTKQEIEKIADAYIDNMDSHSFWDSFISGYETCQKDYEAKVIEKLDLTPTGQSYFDNQRAEHKRIIKNGRKLMENLSESTEDDNFNTLLDAVIESTTGYSCPNCGAICTDRTLISRTDFEFEQYPDPHYSWDETHKCQKCETLYLLHNGT